MTHILAQEYGSSRIRPVCQRISADSRNASGGGIPKIGFAENIWLRERQFSLLRDDIRTYTTASAHFRHTRVKPRVPTETNRNQTVALDQACQPRKTGSLA